MFQPPPILNGIFDNSNKKVFVRNNGWGKMIAFLFVVTILRNKKQSYPFVKD